MISQLNGNGFRILMLEGLRVGLKSILVDCGEAFCPHRYKYGQLTDRGLPIRKSPIESNPILVKINWGK
jgi:hypothetical protein